MKNLFFSIGILSLSSFPVHALKLYLLSDHDRVGDHNQVLGISSAMKKLSPQINIEDLNTKGETPAKINEAIDKDLSHEKVIVVGAGEGGVSGLADITKRPNLITCLTSHMFLDQYKNKDLLEKVDFIALPSHISLEEKAALGSKLIETVGVAHNRRPHRETYETWNKELPPADLYVGVYLGGDAPTKTKEMKLFGEQDAAQLATYTMAVVQRFKDKGLRTSVLVLNGPRTGKYNDQGQEILTVHREGKADPVTEFFAKKLAEKGIQYKVFDFQHKTPENQKWVSSYDAFDLVIGAVKKTKGEMIVPAESTSVISETIDVMNADGGQPGNVIVYYNSAMNDVHKAHVDSELKAGRILLLDNYRDVKTPGESQETKTSAAEGIAKKLLKATS